MQGSDKQQERPQNFELINLLFRNPTPIKTATRRAQQPGTTNIAKPEIFESFQSRFQSFIDQIPSYLHSSEKNGFFTHFFLGSFATLLDTELNKELEVKNIYFRFDGASTLKVMAKTTHKTHVFIFTEDSEINHPLSDQIHNRRFEFTTDELEQINNIRNTEQSGPINEKKIAIQLVHINKSDVTITVDVKKDKPIKRNAGPPPAKFTFKKITTQRGLGDYLENDIKLLAGSDTEQVETVFRKVLAHIKRTNELIVLFQEQRKVVVTTILVVFY